MYKLNNIQIVQSDSKTNDDLAIKSFKINVSSKKNIYINEAC